MYMQKRKTKDGLPSFAYDDPETGKRVRLKRHQHPHFIDEAAARAWARSREAFNESRKNLIEKKLAWKTQFYDFNDLVARFAKFQAVQAVVQGDAILNAVTLR